MKWHSFTKTSEKITYLQLNSSMYFLYYNILFINFHWSCLAVKPSDIENVLIHHTLFVPDHGTSRLTEIHSWITIFNVKIHWLEVNHLTTAFLKDTMFIHNSVIWHPCTIYWLECSTFQLSLLKTWRVYSFILNFNFKFRIHSICTSHFWELLFHQAYIIYLHAIYNHLI
jgi:hypothetical protein